MSNLLITGVAAGATKVRAKHRPTGKLIDVPIVISGAAVPDTLNPTTGAGVLGANTAYTPLQWDAARIYSGSGFASPDHEWHYKKFQNFAPATNDNYYYDSASTLLGGQSAANALYKYGSAQYIDLSNVVPSSIIAGGIAAFRFKWVPVQGNSPPSSQFYTHLATGVRRLWMGRRIAHLMQGQIPGAWKWDITGSDATDAASVTYNTTGGGAGAGFKHGMYGGDPNKDPARAGVSGIVNCTLDGNGNPQGAYQLDNYFDQNNSNGYVGFADKSNTPTTSVDTMLYDGATYDEVVLLELKADGSGNDWAVTRYWKRKVNSDGSVGAWYRVGAYVAGHMFNGVAWLNGETYTTVQPTSKNHNRAIANPRYRDISEWGAFDADVASDPWGCLAADGSHAPLPLVAASTTSQTTSSATFSLTRGTATGVATFAAKIRAVIDGVDQSAANDYTVPFTYGDLDAFPLTLTLATGTHTVAFKTVSADGSQVSSAYPTTPLSVTI